jgi:aryl-alcohol dehydrogenase-like predicted oxidoreductase
VCDELGVCMIAYSPLGLGILGGKYRVGDDEKVFFRFFFERT